MSHHHTPSHKHMPMNPTEAQRLNDMSNYYSGFQRTWHYNKLIHMTYQLVAFFGGNQVGKTAGIMHQYVSRLFGWHPIPTRNIFYFECPLRSGDNLAPHGYLQKREDGIVLPYYERGVYNVRNVPKDGKCPYCGGKLKIHRRVSRSIRLCSETLPGDKTETSADGTQTAEVKNTVYPALKMWLPRFLIKRDLTFRSPAVIVRDPWSGQEFFGEQYIGDDIIFDFVGYSQTVQSSAGVQRMSIFFDEEPPKDFFDEQTPRTFKENGDIIIGLTPANYMTWTYDEIYERAAVYYRTERVCEAMDTNVSQIEMTNSPVSIGVIQASSYDNPTLSKQVLDEKYESISDPDIRAIRFFGIHKQVSGRIFKLFDYRTHYIEFNKYFPNGMFHDWAHYRMIDYHTHNRWAITWLSISPQNEAFVWREFNPSPEKMTTWLICNEVARLSEDYKYKVNLIDALAGSNQVNSTTTTIDDMNNYFMMLRGEGIGTGGFWEPWDTRGIRGREVIRERLSNSLIAGKPFNNKFEKHGEIMYHPTLWICDSCPETAKSMRKWRLEPWANRKDRVLKEEKEKPMQKHSHFCMTLEAAFKDSRVKPPVKSHPLRTQTRYFQGRGHATL